MDKISTNLATNIVFQGLVLQKFFYKLSISPFNYINIRYLSWFYTHLLLLLALL